MENGYNRASDISKIIEYIFWQVNDKRIITSKDKFYELYNK